MNNINAYKFQVLNKDSLSTQFIFESKGERTIVKAIEYSFIRNISGRKVYNLGFGDFNEKNGMLIDDINSNNGDMRKVFNTVLNTIPKFFALNNEAAIWVQGSDSAEDFRAKCEIKCKKKCDEICKNHNRRIKAYKYYVDKNFVQLSKEYIFFGFTSGKNPDFVQYIPNSEYIGILVYKKK